MPGRWSIPAVLTALGLAVRAGAAPPCPGALADVTVFVRNLSPDAAVSVSISGELADPAATCTGSGDAAYQRVLACTGTGLVECGGVSGLRPGAWVNHLSATVNGSGPQTQHQPTVFIGGWGSNALLWTIYPRTVVVADASEPALRDALAAATPGTLVTFAPAASPQTIHLGPGTCPPGHQAALCFMQSGIVVDALDVHGAPGGVTLSVDDLPISVLQVFGSDDVFRGLVFDGSQTAAPSVQSDTVAFTGTDARRNRLEQSIVRGPTRGDAVSGDHGAGGEDAEANVVDGCEVTGARDKGVKVTTAAHVTVRRTCLHDNMNGGVQATLGGHVVALENVVQHNVPGSAQNGIMVRGLSACLDDPTANCDEASSGITSGNVVRFHGGRGVTATDNALATFADDYVADNQIIGSRVETTSADPTTADQPGGAVPQVTFRGVAFICNRHAGLSGTCQPQASPDAATPCGNDSDCCDLPDGCCVNDVGCMSPLLCQPPAIDGFGVTVAQAPGEPVPHVDYGTEFDPGENAFALNQNTAAGTNFKVNVTGLAVDAQGNQWEHCGTTASCSIPMVQTLDVALATGATVALGNPPGPRAGAPVVARVSPPRPRKGELVRVFGQGFNAIEGTACAAATPVDPCSVENPAVEDQNSASNANGLAIVATRDVVLATVWPDAVTPTMLAFRMPFDCFGPLNLRVSKRTDDLGTIATATIPLCDPGGCTDRAAGDPCEDGNACTIGDQCDGNGRCLHGVARVCAGACLLGSCDPDVGCVPLPADAPCDDGDVCTTGDHCSGTGDSCVPGSTDCDDGDPCTTGDVCAAGVCRGVPLDGFPGSICAMKESLVPDLCAADRGGAALEQRARRRLVAAEHLLRRAQMVASVRKRNRLVRRSAAALQDVARLAARWRNGGKLSRGCAGAVRDAVAERRRLVLGLIV